MNTIILSNDTGSPITIPDLSGLTILDAVPVNVTELFMYDRLANSEDLYNYVVSSGIVMNVNGFNLSPERAASYLSYKDAAYIKGIPIGSDNEVGVDTTLSGGYVMEYDGDKVELNFKPYEFKSLRDVNIDEEGNYTVSGTGGSGNPSMGFLDLIDTPTTYSGAEEWAVTVTSGGGLKFSPTVAATIIQSETPPDPDDANLWYSTLDNDIFYYDPTRMAWLTTTAHNYVFSRSGAVAGAYLAIDAVVSSSAYYYIPKNAILTGVIINSEETLNSAKTYYIRDGVTDLGGFTCTNWVYHAFDVNIDVDEGTQMKCYADNVGQSVKNCIVIFEIRWRYDVV
jgi:hypothetical protein